MRKLSLHQDCQLQDMQFKLFTELLTPFINIDTSRVEDLLWFVSQKLQIFRNLPETYNQIIITYNQRISKNIIIILHINNCSNTLK